MRVTKGCSQLQPLLPDTYRSTAGAVVDLGVFCFGNSHAPVIRHVDACVSLLLVLAPDQFGVEL